MSDEQPEEDKTPGRVSWNELVTSDTGSAVKFYTELFGWKHQEMDMGDKTYHFMEHANGPAAGMVQSPQTQPHWMSYVTVESLEASVVKAESLGATVLVEPTQLPMGSFATIKDPQGAAISLWEFAQDGNCDPQ